MSWPARELGFESTSYLEQIQDAFRRVTDGGLPPLIVRYALGGDFAQAADREIRARRDKVVDVWRGQAKSDTGVGRMCKQLLDADAKLRQDASYEDMRWWRDQMEAAQPADSGRAEAIPAADRGHVPSQGQSVTEVPPERADRPSEEIGPAADQLVDHALRPVERPAADASAPVDAGSTIALPRPTGLLAEVLDDRVIVRWEEPPGTPADATFTVQRSDGTQIKQLRPDPVGASVEDREPPAGRPLTYRVTATDADSGGRSVSQPVRVLFAPPICGLSARQVRDGGVECRWSAHPDLWQTRAWRSKEDSPADLDDRTEITTRRDGFDDPRPPLGQHIYSVVPLYKDPDSGEIHEGQRASVTVAVVAPPPVPRLVMDECEGPGCADVTLRWDELPEGTTLMLRRSSAEPSGAAADLLMVEEAAAIGAEVASGLAGTAATVSLPAGRWVLVPFAIIGDRAVRGSGVNVDVIPPVTSPEVLRTGADVLVSWVWPTGMTLAQVVWQAGDIELPREVTLGEYQRQGGIVFTRDEAAKVRISGVVRSRSDELMSVPTTVDVPARSPTLTLDVRSVSRVFGILRSRGKRRVVIVTDLPCVIDRAEIYVHLPDGDPDSDKVLSVTRGLDLGPDRPFDVTVKVPGKDEMDRPIYISCRAQSPAGMLRVDYFRSTGREVR